MFVFQTVITAIIGVAAWGVKNAIGEVKGAITKLEATDKENADKIDDVARDLNALKADLPLIYVTREDFIRTTSTTSSTSSSIGASGRRSNRYGNLRRSH